MSEERNSQKRGNLYWAHELFFADLSQVTSKSRPEGTSKTPDQRALAEDKRSERSRGAKASALDTTKTSKTRSQSWEA
eukprot:6956932-Prymnesium_polylepis.1